MKLKTNILFSLLLCGTFATAQNLKLDILPPSVTLGQDSATVFMKMTLNVPQMDTKNHIRLTPVLTDGTRTAELPQILLNGERAHRLYRRTLALNKRRGKADVTPVFTAIPLTDSDQTIHYRASLPAADWIQFATLNLKKEVINGSGEKVQSENIPIPDTAPHIATATDHFVPQRDRNREAPMAASSPSAPVVPEHRPVSPAPSAPSAKPYFKGSYVSPESDATDERNQKELNFSLDEARVIAEINPQMLSLRELYTVAISYKNTPEQFYKIIDISVKIYPASPVANLNAAAAAIERGNTQAAGRYLQMASHETLAYKNCRGAYELLCNNTYEGIRLLKAAKAEGSEEATYNLKIFFESNQYTIKHENPVCPFLSSARQHPFRFRTENGCQKQPAFRRQRCAECRCGICLRPQIHIRFVRQHTPVETHGRICQQILAHTTGIPLLDLPEIQRQFLGSLSQRSAVQRRREKDAFRTLPLAERAPVCRLAGRRRHKLRIPHHAQPPLEYRSFRRCRV
jgi:hypothetical protein